METLKDGLSERAAVKGGEVKRDNPGQSPPKPAGEKASKGGKTFKIK